MNSSNISRDPRICVASCCWTSKLLGARQPPPWFKNDHGILPHPALISFRSTLSTASRLLQGRPGNEQRAEREAHLVVEHLQLLVVLLQLCQLGQELVAEVEVDEAGRAELGHPGLGWTQAAEGVAKCSKHKTEACWVTDCPLGCELVPTCWISYTKLKGSQGLLNSRGSFITIMPVIHSTGIVCMKL